MTDRYLIESTVKTFWGDTAAHRKGPVVAGWVRDVRHAKHFESPRKAETVAKQLRKRSQPCMVVPARSLSDYGYADACDGRESLAAVIDDPLAAELYQSGYTRGKCRQPKNQT